MTLPIDILVLVTLMWGLNFTLWGFIGFLRYISQKFGRPALPPEGKTDGQTTNPNQIRPDQVAVLMAAHNEEAVLATALQRLTEIFSPAQVYIVSDGSKDSTVDIANSQQVNVLDLQPNRGKAGALKAGLDDFGLASRYAAVLFVDADSVVDRAYLANALPILSKKEVVAIAGFAKTLWDSKANSFWSLFILAHRERVYFLSQRLIKYGQAWEHISVTPIIPGFCSLYKSSILPKLDIATPGLVIEDFNMTFEVHRRKLGKVVMLPQAIGYTQDPDNLKDYTNQVRRWHLGFWQTIRRHGFWTSFFSVCLLFYVAEVLLSSLTLLVLTPLAILQVAWYIVGHVWPLLGLGPGFPELFNSILNPLKLLGMLIVADYALSIIVFLTTKRPQYLWYGPFFVFMKLIDAWTFINALPKAFIVRSSGAWVSPIRRKILPVSK